MVVGEQATRTRPYADSVTNQPPWLNSTLQASTRRLSMTFSPCSLVLSVNMCYAGVLCPRTKPRDSTRRSSVSGAHPTRSHLFPFPYASQTWRPGPLAQLTKATRLALADSPTHPHDRHRISGRRHPIRLHTPTPRPAFATTNHIFTTNERVCFPPQATWRSHPHQNHPKMLAKFIQLQLQKQLVDSHATASISKAILMSRT